MKWKLFGEQGGQWITFGCILYKHIHWLEQLSHDSFDAWDVYNCLLPESVDEVTKLFFYFTQENTASSINMSFFLYNWAHRTCRQPATGICIIWFCSSKQSQGCYSNVTLVGSRLLDREQMDECCSVPSTWITVASLSKVRGYGSRHSAPIPNKYLND